MAEAAPLVIKKYGNRRLYDTEASRYITLEDLAQVIRGGRDVRVVDAKSGADLTKSVLIQIIAEQEKSYDLLPTVFLRRMIQLGDSQLRESLHRYLSISLDSFLQAQHEFEKRYRQMAGNLLNPFSWIFSDGAPVPQGPAGVEQPADAGPAAASQHDASRDRSSDPSAEISELRQQLAAIQQTLRELKK